MTREMEDLKAAARTPEEIDEMREFFRVACDRILNINLTMSQHRELAQAFAHAGYQRIKAAPTAPEPQGGEALAQWQCDCGARNALKNSRCEQCGAQAWRAGRIATPATPGAEPDAWVAEIEKRHGTANSSSRREHESPIERQQWAFRYGFDAHNDRATLLAILRAQSLPHGRIEGT